MKKQKSFLMNFVWVAILLSAMGILFSSIAVITQFVPIAPEDVTVYVNGIRRPPTEESVATFRLAFLLSFGIIGVVLLGAGGIVGGRIAAQKRRTRHLKNNGMCVTAQATECTSSSIRVNHRYLTHLNCSYKAPNGITYIFKSGTLRMNPIPYLTDGKVEVYYDRDNIKHYFVDVDGSASLGVSTIEI